MFCRIKQQLAIAAAFLLSLVFASPTTVNNSTTDANNSSLNSYKVASYFVNWGIYARNFTPQELPASKLSHVLYAFANLRADGTVYLSDTYADLQKHFPGDSWQETGNNVYGCIKQLYLLKKKNRQLKTLLSIGGWSYSANFAAAASTNESRATFASTAVTFVKDLGFDGIDIDWEYPQDDTEASNFVLLLEATRSALDNYAAANSTSNKFLLTVASPAGPTNYKKLHFKEMDTYLDAWHLMAYDYAGSWSNMSGHDANLYHCKDDPVSTPFSTHTAVTDYIAAGVNASKIVMGMPIYGRGFASTTGIGKSFTGTGAGTWEPGVYDYKTLISQNASNNNNITYDKNLGAAYTYNPSTQELISFDTVEVVQQKVQYVREQKLGGAMFWESSADGSGDMSLISRAFEGLGRLDGGENCLDYKGSQYANLAGGMVENNGTDSSGGSKY